MSDATELWVISDAVCPWCFVGKRRLDKALAALASERAFLVRWRPFELNPHMPAAGMDRRDYRARKFGSLARSDELDARLVEVGQGDGIEFRFDSIERTPNTFAAHRLAWYAEGKGKQDAVVDGLFRAYFSEGRDIGDSAVLADIAEHAGLERAEVVEFLASDCGAAEVRTQERQAREAGVDGVPSFFLDGRFVFSGAAPPDTMAEVLVAAS